jgi:hypothetical protein
MAECNAPVFLQKSMGSDDVGYLYDNSRIYGRKVYFRFFITSIANAYLNSYRVHDMIPPEHVLRALNDLLSENQTTSRLSQDIFSSIFATENGHWSCLIRKQNSVDWFVRPLFQNQESLPVQNEKMSAQSTDWVEIPELTDHFRNLPNLGDSSALVRDVLNQSCVVQRGSAESIFCVQCESFQLVADLLQEAGPPPHLVVQDWKKQLASMNRNSSSLSPAETFVTEDGVLVPLPESFEKWSAVPQYAEHSPRLAAHWEMKSSRWPWSTSPSSLTQGSGDPATNRVAWLNAADTIHSSDTIRDPAAIQRRNPKRRKASRHVIIGTAVAGTLGIGILVWMSGIASQFGDANRSTMTSKELGTAKEFGTAKGQIDSVPSTNVVSPELSSDNQEITTLDGFSGKADELSSATEADTLESLLSQLQPTSSSKFNLGSMNASSIISDALKSGSVPNHVLDSNGSTPFGEKIAMLDDNNIVEGEKEDDPSQVAKDVLDQVELKQDELNPEGMSLEKILTTDSFNKKELIFIGHRVQPKQCRCDVKLKLSKELVVEPTEQVSIEGVDKASWKIAMEDEEPELILEISSKPGSRWQISTAVGLRVTSASVPIMLSPRDAQTVCNRLIDYHQWISNSIVALENAKANVANVRSKSRIDFYGEIKKLERQQRDVDKAIAQWKTIAKLSHLFFDGNEVHLTFIPMKQE